MNENAESLELDDDDEDLIKAIEAMPSQQEAISSESFGHGEVHGYPCLKTADISLDIFKHGRQSLSVTDLVNQFWCEQQFEYHFTKPIVKPVPEIVSTGSAIHLEKELEVHDIIPVICHTKEDAWGIKLLNCHQQLTLLSQGATIRELPIFGCLFDEEIFVQGIIDEIRFNANGFIEIRELKTRSFRSLPSNSQHKKNALQVSIYRKLLDDLLVKKSGLEAVRKHVSLNWERALSEDIVEYGKELGFDCPTLEEIANIFVTFLQVYNFPEFGLSVIEYCYQNDKQTIGCITCEYEESSLRETLAKQYDYLLGKRQATGVDIEDAWKCNSCDYADVCAWRKKQEVACRSRNALNFKPR